MATKGQRVVVVTGGGSGIGAAVAAELGRHGAFVVTLDPMVTVDGTEALVGTGPTTAERIVEAGGSARASHASVIDRDAVSELFEALVSEFGGVDAVVNMAGISRPTDLWTGTEADWAAVLDVHLGGYLTVLGVALPLMAEAGHGRILGVTSGAGWRPASTGAYGCAKRAVAALTWELGRVTPPGVTVNAVSPIAATRMVPAGATAGGDAGRSGGLSLSALPPPEQLGPVVSYLASEEFGWSSGAVVFSNGSEIAPIVPPRLLEVCRTGDPSLPHVLDRVMAVALTPAEQAQATNGAANARLGGAFFETVSAARSAIVRRSVVVTDEAAWGAAIADALAARGIAGVGVGAWSGSPNPGGEVATDFDGAARQLASAVGEGGPVDAVVVALAGADARTDRRGWERVLAEHRSLPEQIRADAAWACAVAGSSTRADRPVRLVTVTAATTSGGRSRAQAAAQLARATRTAPAGIEAYAISVETSEPEGRRSGAELAACLLAATDGTGLAGAELVVSTGWVGLRSHPGPAASLSFGGPTPPHWLDRALRQVVSERAR